MAASGRSDEGALYFRALKDSGEKNLEELGWENYV